MHACVNVCTPRHNAPRQLHAERALLRILYWALLGWMHIEAAGSPALPQTKHLFGPQPSREACAALRCSIMAWHDVMWRAPCCCCSAGNAAGASAQARHRSAPCRQPGPPINPLPPLGTARAAHGGCVLLHLSAHPSLRLPTARALQAAHTLCPQRLTFLPCREGAQCLPACLAKGWCAGRMGSLCLGA